MRTLDRNKTMLWYVECIGVEDVVDEEGYFTGEKRKVYGEPVRFGIHLYPADGMIMEQLFGRDADFSKLAISETLLSKDALLFLNTPVEPYEENYDYMVERNKRSMNHNNYGLRSRV